MNKPESSKAPKHQPTATEKWLLWALAAIQFTTILDFLIILPLGPQYMRVFNITPGQFGLIVSSYAISAGIFGLLAGFMLDRMDRKPALLWLYLGFTVGTFLCALAPNYHLLVAARAVAGAFGGVAGALILAIIGDAIPENRRGAAMGMVMSSFSIASICGVPIGLLLATHLNWHVPFYALTGLCLIILGASAWAMPSMRGHLAHAHSIHPVRRMLQVLLEPSHQMAFIFMAVLTFAGFCVFPNVSTYMVQNVGLTEAQLPLIYLAGGICTFFSMNWIGRWSDRAGKRHVFVIMSFLTAVPILTLTHLPRVPVAVAIGVSTLLMVCMSGRMVPAMALMTASVEPRYRGGFMSVNSSVQQFASGLAAFTSGQLIGQSPTGELTRFGIVGFISVACAYTCIYLVRFLKHPTAKSSEPAAVVEG